MNSQKMKPVKKISQVLTHERKNWKGKAIVVDALAHPGACTW